MHSLELPASFQLSEDDRTKQRRSTLNDRLQKLQAATSKISEFRDTSSGPFQSVPEHAAPAFGPSSAIGQVEKQGTTAKDLQYSGTSLGHHYMPTFGFHITCVYQLPTPHAICWLLRFMATIPTASRSIAHA